MPMYRSLSGQTKIAKPTAGPKGAAQYRMELATVIAISFCLWNILDCVAANASLDFAEYRKKGIAT